jgi:hypothetical protein
MKTKQKGKPKKKRASAIRYSESLKRRVCQEFLKGEKGQRAILTEYGVRFHGAIPRWMNEFNLVSMRRKRIFSVMKNKDLHKSTPIVKETKKTTDQSERIKELERQLEDSQLQAEAYLRIIEFAERELKIPIQKKRDTE